MKEEEFIKLMTEFISIKHDEDVLRKSMLKFDDNFGYISFERYEDLTLKVFEKSLKTDWVSYYLYECDCGKSPKEVATKERTFKLKTLKQLWWLIDRDLK